MIIIKHRINKIKDLKKLNKKLGVEVDIRSNLGKLIIHHDPFENGEDFNEWIKHYNHKFLILNVKEEGLEEKLIKKMDEFKIINYFFLDQSFPFIFKYYQFCNKRSAIRLSEFESITNCKLAQNLCDWVWVDCFNKFILTKSQELKLRQMKYKICIVSPELQGRFERTEIVKIKEKINLKKIKIDAVCTKFPELWDFDDIV